MQGPDDATSALQSQRHGGSRPCGHDRTAGTGPDARLCAPRAGRTADPNRPQAWRPEGQGRGVGRALSPGASPCLSPRPHVAVLLLTVRAVPVCPEASCLGGSGGPQTAQAPVSPRCPRLRVQHIPRCCGGGSHAGWPEPSATRSGRSAPRSQARGGGGTETSAVQRASLRRHGECHSRADAS